jgi:hypothetical protein
VLDVFHNQIGTFLKHLRLLPGPRLRAQNIIVANPNCVADFCPRCGLTSRGPAQFLDSRGPRPRAHLSCSLALFPLDSFPFVSMPLLFQSDTLGESPSALRARSLSAKSKVTHAVNACLRYLFPNHKSLSLFFFTTLLMLHFSLSYLVRSITYCIPWHGIKRE